jgi:hypothetical protein
MPKNTIKLSLKKREREEKMKRELTRLIMK